MADDDYPELEKACDFIDEAEEAGWEVNWDENAQEDTTSVTAERGAETLEIAWGGNRMLHVLYSHDGEGFRNLRNVADARARLEGEPLPPARRGRKPAPQPVEGEEEEQPAYGDVRILPRILPFDPETADDDSIISAVRGRTLIWWNRWMLGYDQADVLPAKQKHIRVDETEAGRVVLHFVSPEGFRSIALDTLAQVR